MKAFPHFYSMTKPSKLLYGFGWRLNKDLKNKIVSHSGSNPGYKTRIVRLLDKRKTIIILSNNDFSLNKIEQNLINELSN